MPRTASAPIALRQGPFLAGVAVDSGLVTSRQLQHRQWRRLFPDVFVHESVPITFEVRCAAVTLWLDGRGVISGMSAARLLGAPLLFPGPIEVTIPAQMNIRPQRGLTFLRSSIAVGDITELRGVLLTSPVRTAFDLARRLPRVDALVELDALLGTPSSRDTLLAYTAERRKWAGANKIALLLPDVEPRSESPMETRMRITIVDGGLPRPVAQFEVRAADGHLVGRLDLAYPQKKLGLEYEGDYHRERVAFQRDLRRYNDLKAAGWTVLRFGPDEVLRNPARLVAQVRAALGC
jgi:hypothetical protein